MLDPIVGYGAFAYALLTFPVFPSLDPGPSPDCPNDMRLVSGTHYETMMHVCLEPRTDVKSTHCFEYAEGMSAMEGPADPIRVCMDQFEAPNKRGVEPYVMRSYESAQRWCGRQKKRVCTEQEWELACEGPEHLPLAYGWAVNVQLCNSAKTWRPVDFEAFGKGREEAEKESKRLWQGAVSGAYKTCVSPFGIYDLNGNVEEWVTSRKSRKWPGSLMGGFWAKPWTGCRGTNDAHEPTFAFYETGFRCCQDPSASESVPDKKP